MNLQSMTGFSRAIASHNGASIAWEARSVNGKSLEARFRLPPGYDRLEQPARQKLRSRFSRGNIQASLSIARTSISTAPPVVNEAFLRDVAGLAKRLEEQFGVSAPSADGLLALRGVLEPQETLESEEERAALDGAVLSALDAALDELEQSRRGEGGAIGSLLVGQMDAIEGLVLKAEADPSRDPAAIRERLAEQVRLLLDVSSGLDENRLHTEAAFLAARADIREEIDRLKTHIASIRALLESGGPIGRKLDFLAQELNRESNTICSKSNGSSLSAIGLELKAVVDQFREQVQNLE